MCELVCARVELAEGQPARRGHEDLAIGNGVNDAFEHVRQVERHAPILRLPVAGVNGPTARVARHPGTSGPARYGPTRRGCGYGGSRSSMRARGGARRGDPCEGRRAEPAVDGDQRADPDTRGVVSARVVPQAASAI